MKWDIFINSLYARKLYKLTSCHPLRPNLIRCQVLRNIVTLLFIPCGSYIAVTTSFGFSSVCTQSRAFDLQSDQTPKQPYYLTPAIKSLHGAIPLDCVRSTIVMQHDEQGDSRECLQLYANNKKCVKEKTNDEKFWCAFCREEISGARARFFPLHPPQTEQIPKPKNKCLSERTFNRKRSVERTFVKICWHRETNVYDLPRGTILAV